MTPSRPKSHSKFPLNEAEKRKLVWFWHVARQDTLPTAVLQGWDEVGVDETGSKNGG